MSEVPLYMGSGPNSRNLNTIKFALVEPFSHQNKKVLAFGAKIVPRWVFPSFSKVVSFIIPRKLANFGRGSRLTALDVMQGDGADQSIHMGWSDVFLSKPGTGQAPTA